MWRPSRHGPGIRSSPQTTILSCSGSPTALSTTPLACSGPRKPTPCPARLRPGAVTDMLHRAAVDGADLEYELRGTGNQWLDDTSAGARRPGVVHTLTLMEAAAPAHRYPA